MSKKNDVYIVAAVRTPVGKGRGALSTVRPDDLLAHVIRAAMDKVPSIQPELVEDVIIGCAMPEAEQGMNVARIAALLAGLPNSVPAQTINRFCSSGLQAISMAADKIALGDADVMIAGGTESMSMVPLGGYHYSANPKYFENQESVAIAYGMGITAEKVAAKWDISREEQDLFAIQSHERALKAIKAGAFKDEIVPITVKTAVPNLKTGTIDHKTKVVDTDEGPREGTNVAAMQKLKTVFMTNGSVTAGTSSQISDGAAALVLVSQKIIDKYDLKPLAKFSGFSVQGVPPEYMGIGPIKAIPKVLKMCGLTLGDIDWIELNEAFAAQSLAVIKELNLSTDRVNPYGGAIALGHPLGATGAIRAVTLIHGMHKKHMRYGMVTMCIGTGMGAAGIIEVL